MGDEKIKIYFKDILKGRTLGIKYMYIGEIKKWGIETLIQIQGDIYKIKFFAVNEGFPEGSINLEKLKMEHIELQ